MSEAMMNFTPVYESPTYPCAVPSHIGMHAQSLSNEGWDVVQVIPPAPQPNPFPFMGDASLFQQGAYTFLVRKMVRVQVIEAEAIKET